MKGKIILSMSIRGEEFVLTLQIRKEKLKLARHTKFVGKCAFRPVVGIPKSTFAIYFTVADYFYIISPMFPFLILTVLIGSRLRNSGVNHI